MERPNNGPEKKGSGGLWLLAGLAGLVVIKNPEILDWLVAFGEGLNAHAEKKAIQLLETQQQEFLIPQPLQPNPEPPTQLFRGPSC